MRCCGDVCQRLGADPSDTYIALSDNDDVERITSQAAAQPAEIFARRVVYRLAFVKDEERYAWMALISYHCPYQITA